MTDKEYCDTVKTMNKEQLLDAVMENPEYLVDAYYFYPLGKALQSRYEELAAEIGDNHEN